MNQVLFNILSGINSVTQSWGWAMVVFTFLIRLIMTPLDVKSRSGMRKTQTLQPKMAELQKKYANDKEKLNQKTAELYKKEGVNPMSSCLPLLLTWPILIIVFNAMRQVANMEILGQVEQILNNNTDPSTFMEPWLWIKNLWMPDSLFSSAWPQMNTLRQIPADQWKTWFSSLEEMPLLMQGLNLTGESFDTANLQATIQTLVDAMTSGNAAYAAGVATQSGWTFNLFVTTLSVPGTWNGLMILPIMSSVSQIIMTKITGSGQQPQSNDASASSGKFMMYFFPIFSLVICFGYSSAFALYWVSGNLISMAQTVLINKYLDSKDAKQAQVAGKGSVK